MTAHLWLAGDVMPGRGVDQILPHPVSPELAEPWLQDARAYVALAEARHGRLPRRAPLDWPWGEVLANCADAPGLVNLEAAITRRGQPDPDKSIHYRMAPEHAGLLTLGGVRVCSLANNHVLDWGLDGLRDTLDALGAIGIAVVGAGLDQTAAEASTVLHLSDGHHLRVWAAATRSSGVPAQWQALPDRAGVALLDDDLLVRWQPAIAAAKQAGEWAAVSLHWGGNWGWQVPEQHRCWAHALVDAGADLVHGHSSHHPLPLEVYRNRLIVYGCGDLLNDYEGISGNDEFRPDLAGLFRVQLAASGALQRLEVVACRRAQFQLHPANTAAQHWLGAVLALAQDARLTISTGEPCVLEPNLKGPES